MDNAGLKYIQAVDCHICLAEKVKHVRHYQFLSVTKTGQRVMKWDTVSGSLLHSGQSSVRFLLARDVANILKSVLSLVNRRRMSGFRISFIYLGTTYSFDGICLVANRVDDAMEFLQT